MYLTAGTTTQRTLSMVTTCRVPHTSSAPARTPTNPQGDIRSWSAENFEWELELTHPTSFASAELPEPSRFSRMMAMTPSTRTNAACQQVARPAKSKIPDDMLLKREGPADSRHLLTVTLGVWQGRGCAHRAGYSAARPELWSEEGRVLGLQTCSHRYKLSD
eukprot:2614178-Rhodomonas_salina.2